jgi:hypothetical protein
MTPNTLASIPAALNTAGNTATLDTPIDDFLRLNRPPRNVARAVQTVAMILRVDRISGLCSSEADNLLANRFSPEITRQVCKHLWGWLLSRVPGPGTRLADAKYEPQDIRYDDVDDVDDDDDFDDDDEMIVEAPPQDGEALDRWADRYGVRDRLADRLDLERLHHSYYGSSMMEGLPETIREAVLVTPGRNQGPTILSRYPGFPAGGHGQIAPAPRGAGGGHRAPSADRACRPNTTDRRSVPVCASRL